MDKCGKLDEKVEGIDESVFEKMDLDLAEEVLVFKISIKSIFLNIKFLILILSNRLKHGTNF